MLGLLIAAAVAGANVTPSDYVSPPRPQFFDDSKSDSMFNAYLNCVTTNTMDLGVAHKEVPALDIVHAAAVTRCDSASPGHVSWADLSTVAHLKGRFEGARMDLEEWRKQCFDQIAAELTAKRIGS